jgi:hypothetical protein
LSRFLIPSFQVELAGLPPAILTSEPGSFARYTLKERVPGIVQEAVALNAFPDDIREAMDELYAELTGEVIRDVYGGEVRMVRHDHGCDPGDPSCQSS